MTFKNMKIRIKDEEHSKAVQEALFALGYRWVPNGFQVAHTEKDYLLTWSEGDITYGDIGWGREKYQEVVLEMIPTFVPVRSKVEVLGKTYYKEDIEKALASLSVVEE